MKKYGLAVLTLTLVLSVAGLSGCKSGSNTDSGKGSSYDTGDAELDEALSKVEKYDAASLVELGVYKGVEVDTSVTQDDIDGAIMNLLSENTTVKKIKKGKVKEGDTVNIDFTGSSLCVCTAGTAAASCKSCCHCECHSCCCDSFH